MPPDVVEEVLVIILKITIIVCGSLVAGRLVLAKCSRWLEWAASRLGVNEYAVLGLLTSLVSSVSMLPLYPRMDARGRMINAAFTVSGAFVSGKWPLRLALQTDAPLQHILQQSWPAVYWL